MSDLPAQVDLLVVGLGPGGGCAARAAARAGLTVLAVDKKTVPGVPVQCAEFMPRPMTAESQVRAAKVQDIHGMRTYLQGRRTDTEHFLGLMVDRRDLDAGLARQAAEAGAVLAYGTRLTDLDAEQGVARLHGPAGSHIVRFRYLVAADGPRSPVARHLGLPELAHVYTRQYTVPLREPFATTDIWLSPDYPGGYAWLFPKGEVANLGLGLDKRYGDLKAPLDALHRQLQAEGRVRAEILDRTGGEIPVGGMRERAVVGRVLFVGDALGLTHPITGAGIAPAMVSGEAAGEAVAAHLGGDPEALADYEEEMNDRYRETLNRAVAKRARIEAALAAGQPLGERLFRATWIAFDEYYEHAVA